MMRTLLSIGLLALATSSVLADDESSGQSSAKADAKTTRLHAAVQGKWQRFVQNNGEQIRLVKHVDGKQETFSAYRGDDVIYAHRVDFEVKATDTGNVFSYRNMIVTAGPNEGNKSEEARSYLFTIKNDTWYEVHGLLPGDDATPSVTEYERVKST